MRFDRQTKILIIGCGSLGSSLAVRLARQADVVCYDTNAALVRKIRQNGIALKGKVRQACRTVCACDQLKDLKGMAFDGILVTTKCADVKNAAEAVAQHCRAQRVLFLQNGEFSLDWAGRVFPGTVVCRGVTTTAVHANGFGQVEVFFDGDFYVGPYDSHPASARWFAQLFRSAGMRTHVVKDYRRAVWAKLIFSAVMNPLPIIWGTGYDVIRQDIRAYQQVQLAIQEGKAVAGALGIRLAFDPARLVSRVRRDRGALAHLGSMYNDFMQKQPLEIDHMTGVVIREARRLGLKAPVLTEIYQATHNAVRRHA